MKPKPDDINAVVDGVISQLKAKGTFDKFRRECLAESDAKPAYINLHNRVTTTVDAFLRGLTWTPSFPKINTRNQMRRRIEEAPYFKSGIENVVEQSLRGRMNSEFIPVIEDEVFSYMGIDKDNENAVEELPPPPPPGNRPFQFIGSDFLPPTPVEMIAPAPPPPPMEPPPPPPAEEGPEDTRPVEAAPVDMGSVEMRSVEMGSEEMESDEGKAEEVYDEGSMDEVDEESEEEESPMFEKIGDVSPPRPVLLEDSDIILRELQEEALRNSKLKLREVEVDVPKIPLENECRFLESPPLFKKKMAYYKKLPAYEFDK